MTLLDLPEEILLHVASFLSTYDRVKSFGPTCKYLHWLLQSESKRGSFWNHLLINCNRINHVVLKLGHSSPKQWLQYCQDQCSPISSIHVKNISGQLPLSQTSEIVRQVLQTLLLSDEKTGVKSLSFERFLESSLLAVLTRYIRKSSMKNVVIMSQT